VSEKPMLTPDQEAKMLMMLLAPGGLMSAGKNIELARQYQGA
jgi:hypothetical protein